MSAIRHKTIAGTLWNFSEQLLTRGIGVAVTIMLAWFLEPEEYGLVAMMSVFLVLSSALVDAGFSQALIRKLNTTPTDYSTAFYANLMFSLLIYLALFLGAPYISGFYQQPVLVELIRVAGLSVFFNAFAFVQKAVLTREMKFKLQLKVSLPAAFLSGALAIYLAYNDYGVWALIIQLVSVAFLTALFYWRLKLWRPSLLFSLKSLKELFSFGGYLLIESVSAIPFRNMYVIVIAKFFSATIAGLYFFADKIKELVMSQFVQSIQNVTYPALAKLQEDDARLKIGFRKVIAVTTFILFPAMVFLAALADPLFATLFSKKWLDAVVFLQLMCLAGLFNPLNAINLNILKVKGRSDIVLYVGIYKKTVAIGIFIFTLQYGVIAILLGQILNSVLAYIPNSYFSSRLIDYTVTEQVADFAPGLVLSFVIALLVYFLQQWVEWLAALEVLVFGLLAIGLYVLIAHVLRLQAYRLVRELLVSKIR